jgi:hypothetical protein
MTREPPPDAPPSPLRGLRELARHLPPLFDTTRHSTLEEHARQVNAGRVSPAIQWMIDGQRVQTPFADCDDRRIVIQETFGAYLWAVCYALHVVDGQLRKSRVDARSSAGDAAAGRADVERLFEWAMRLVTAPEPASDGVPHPMDADPAAATEEAMAWTEEGGHVNGLFVSALAYIACHEYAHLVNGHCAFVSDARTRVLTD